MYEALDGGVPNVACRIEEMAMSTVIVFIISLSIKGLMTHVEFKE